MFLETNAIQFSYEGQFNGMVISNSHRDPHLALTNRFFTHSTNSSGTWTNSWIAHSNEIQQLRDSKHLSNWLNEMNSHGIVHVTIVAFPKPNF